MMVGIWIVVMVVSEVRRHVLLFLSKSREAKLNGLVKFLRRSEVDPQFQTRVGILVVLCSRVDLGDGSFRCILKG